MTKTKGYERTRIFWLIRRDLPSVLKIEGESFEYPWTEEEFIRSLSQRDCIGMVVCDGDDEQIIGFMIYELHKQRIHVLSMAVAADHRRKGVGTEMLEKLISKLAYPRRNRIAMEVRESNLAAQLFLRKNGFKATGVLKDFYLNHSNEDGYMFAYRADELVSDTSSESKGDK